MIILTSCLNARHYQHALFFKKKTWLFNVLHYGIKTCNILNISQTSLTLRSNVCVRWSGGESCQQKWLELTGQQITFWGFCGCLSAAKQTSSSADTSARGTSGFWPEEVNTNTYSTSCLKSFCCLKTLMWIAMTWHVTIQYVYSDDTVSFAHPYSTKTVHRVTVVDQYSCF